MGKSSVKVVAPKPKGKRMGSASYAKKSGKLSTTAMVAKINKQLSNERNLRSTCSNAEKDAQSTSAKRKSMGQIVFDELANPQESKKKKRGPVTMQMNPLPLRVRRSNPGKVEQVLQSQPGKVVQATKTKSNKTATMASFIEGQQEMQMAVNMQEEDLFHTDGSEAGDDPCLQHETDEDSDELESMPSSQSESEESEAEDGQIMEAVPQPSSSTKKGANSGKAAKEVAAIDQEMEQRIIDLHDRMEESGLEGAMNLIEQLFDKKPGQDMVEKKKIKQKACAGIAKEIRKKQLNSNDNRTTVRDNVNAKENSSELTIYKNTVDKRTSSSSEEGFNTSDKANLFSTLVLDAVGGAERQAARSSEEQTELLQSSRQEIKPEDHALDMVRLAEHAKASLMPPRGETNFDLNNLNLIDKLVNINKSVSVMDQDYIVVSGHVDQAIQERIT